ncbi:MAG TPA: transferrin receptor-like dimerization domain-containing protein [Gemmatimonadales bacterium]|nr:transferrin receptor-like dimerization domain-containing protein [Gemmatimonadales bacterium]
MRLPIRPIVVSALVGTLLAAAPRDGDPRPLPGFGAAAAARQRQWEERFMAMPSPDSLRSYMRRLAARPHHVGSPADKANAEWLRDQFAAWGWDATIERFDVLFPTPRERVVELVAPTKFRARLDEPATPVDPTSGQKGEQLPSYNAYSIDGDVTAPLVYVNYGVPADYERLERLGVSVEGAIVIARYGGSWRGIKPKVAAEHGAIGCLIYSDPRDDGYYQGDAYPQGPMRPRDGVQRGSVADMPLYPGDPLTPGVGATRDAERLPRERAATLTRIPVLPISSADAEPLLRALGGPVAPAEWRGALPLTFHVGPGPARVHLKVKSDWQLRPIYDVIARLRGSEAPDEWILRGNHHDAWVNGAVDPVSGLAAELEEARALGELVKQGWRPRRTLVYAAWDGEEPGLLGSTEWVETHADELARHAAVYLNTDANDRGFLDMGGSHTLETFINGVARDVTDPETGLSVWKREQLRRIAQGSAEARREARERGELRIDALGSGSDFTPFLQHAGIASLSLEFGNEGPGASGVYHSIYDDYYWHSHFGDTSFVYGRALAQTVGVAVMRLAGADVLPYQFGGLASAVSKYKDEVVQLLTTVQDAVRERNRQLDEGVFTAVRDPRAPEAAPAREPAPPFLNFAPLENGTARLDASARRYDALLARLSERRDPPDGAALAAVNAHLVRAERALASADGLPGRPWFRHQIYAPGFYTGYGVKTLPGVREAIEQQQWDEANTQIARLEQVLDAEAAVIDSASAALERVVGAAR